MMSTKAMRLYNYQTKRFEEVPEDGVANAVMSGSHAFDPSSMVTVQTGEGRRVVSGNDATLGVRDGWMPLPPSTLMREEEGGFVGTAKAGVEGLLRGVVPGFTMAETALGVDPERIKAREEESPIVSGLSHLIGLGLGTAIAPERLAFLPAAKITKVAASKADDVLHVLNSAKSPVQLGELGQAIGSYGIATSLESIPFTLNDTLNEIALGEPIPTAEEMVARLGMGAALGGALGSGLAGLAVGGPRLAMRGKEALGGAFEAALGTRLSKGLKDKLTDIAERAAGKRPGELEGLFEGTLKRDGPDALKRLEELEASHVDRITGEMRLAEKEALRGIRKEQGAAKAQITRIGKKITAKKASQDSLLRAVTDADEHLAISSIDIYEGFARDLPDTDAVADVFAEYPDLFRGTVPRPKEVRTFLDGLGDPRFEVERGLFEGLVADLRHLDDPAVQAAADRIENGYIRALAGKHLRDAYVKVTGDASVGTRSELRQMLTDFVQAAETRGEAVDAGLRKVLERVAKFDEGIDEYRKSFSRPLSTREWERRLKEAEQAERALRKDIAKLQAEEIAQTVKPLKAERERIEGEIAKETASAATDAFEPYALAGLGLFGGPKAALYTAGVKAAQELLTDPYKLSKRIGHLKLMKDAVSDSVNAVIDRSIAMMTGKVKSKAGLPYIGKGAASIAGVKVFDPKDTWEENLDRLDMLPMYMDAATLGLDDMPVLKSAYEKQISQGIAYLQEQAPRGNVLTSIGRQRNTVVPESEKLAFRRKVDMVTEPLRTLEATVESRSLSRDHISALRSVYPSLYGRLQQEWLLKLQEEDVAVPYEWRLMLSQLFGIQDPILSPMFVSAMQMQYNELTNAANQNADMRRRMKQSERSASLTQQAQRGF